MTVLNKVRSYFSLWMVGRNGYDGLNYTLLVCFLLSTVLTGALSWGLLSLFSTVLFCVIVFRFASKDLAARRQENRIFQRYTSGFTHKVKEELAVLRDREHSYFRCPECNHRLRVPKGKGLLKVTCSSCYHVFHKKS